MDEWVYGCRDHNAYINHYIESFGIETLYALKARAFYSAPANYGSAYTSVWDEHNRIRMMGITLEEFEKFMKEKGVLHE